MFLVFALCLLARRASSSCNIPVPNCLECDESNSCIACDSVHGYAVDGDGGCGCAEGFFPQSTSSITDDIDDQDDLDDLDDTDDQDDQDDTDDQDDQDDADDQDDQDDTDDQDDIVSNFECVRCSDVLQGCSKCDDSRTCTECISPYRIDQITQKCFCPEGFFEGDLGEGCLPCIVGCSSCSNGSSCELCDIEQNFIFNSGVCECDTGYYLDELVGACIPCDLEFCADCDNSEQCSTCQEGFVLDTETFQCDCPADSYYDQSIQQCIACEITGCLECSFRGVCTLCDETNNFELNSNTLCSCKEGFFLDDTQIEGRTCSLCSLEWCQECISANRCLSCVDPFVVNENTGQCGCPQGFYFNVLTEDCGPCDVERCAECPNAIECSECISPFELDDEGQCNCPQGFYFNVETEDCGPCDVEKCAECPNPAECSECISPFELNDEGQCTCPTGSFLPEGSQECLSCEIEGCLDCSDAGTCVECDSDGFFELTTDSKCDCQPGFYLGFPSGELFRALAIIQRQCLPCILEFCLECSSSEKCTLCGPGFVLNEDTRLCECPESQYFNESTESCENCVTGCSSCLTGRVCEVCDESNNFELVDGLCVCKSGFYLEEPDIPVFERRLEVEEDKTCAPCESVLPGCLECESATVCSSCELPLVLNEESTECECPSGSILVGDSCEIALTAFSEAVFFSAYAEESVQYTFAYDRPIGGSLCQPFQERVLLTLFAVRSACEIINQDLFVTFYYTLPLAQQVQQLHLLQYYQPPSAISFQSVLQDLGDQYALPDDRLEILGPTVYTVLCSDSSLELSVQVFNAICADESQYTWDVVGDNISDRLKQVVTSQTGLSLSIPSEALYTGTFYFTVTVNSVFNIQFFDNHKVEVLESSLLVTLTPSGPNYSISASDSLEIEAFTPEVCPGEAIVYLWTFESLWERLTDDDNSGDIANPAILEINPGDLPVGGPYVYTLFVSHGLAEAEVSININVSSSGPVAVINLEDGEFENTSDLFLDASGSFDSDNPNGSLYYVWLCSEETSPLCLDSDNVPLFEASSRSYITIAKERLRVGAVYTFELTVLNNFGTSDKTRVTLTITERPLGIDDVDHVVNAQDEFEVCAEISEPAVSFVETQIYGQPIPEARRLDEKVHVPRNLTWDSSPNEICLSFEGGVFPEGEVFGYNIEYTGESGTVGNVEIYFYTNLPPECGNMEIHDLGDKWYVNIDNCDDPERRHYSLRYFLYSTNEDKVTYHMSNSQFHFKFVYWLRSGSHIFTGKVCDTIGSCTELTPVGLEVQNRRLLAETLLAYRDSSLAEYIGVFALLFAGIVGVFYFMKLRGKKASSQFA